MLGGDTATTYSEWAGGNCLIPIVIGDYFPSLQYTSPKLEGVLTLNLRFTAQLTAPLNCYSLAISPTELSVTRDGSVIVSP
jgi:hypothetical protein